MVVAHSLGSVVAYNVPLDAPQTFNVTPPIANKGDVLNFTDNRHGIEGYLADPVVAQQVVWGLQTQ